MRRFILFAILGLVLAGSQPASGFDGSRKGFVLGLGAGLGGVHNDPAVGGSEREFGVKTDLTVAADRAKPTKRRRWIFTSLQKKERVPR